MTTAAPMADSAEQPVVQRGHIYQLGRHRLMCGDATSKDDVATLFAEAKPTLVVTSPPYAKRRNYDRPISCWDSLMMGAFGGHPFAQDAQLLINLGPIHANGEWVPYWERWLAMMRGQGWRISGQYIWDKIKPPFGQNHGRCRSAHEYIFHINKQAVLLNDTVTNKSGGSWSAGKNIKEKNGTARKCIPGAIKKMRPPESIFRVYPAFNNRTGHPAVFPVALASQLIGAWKKPSCVAYDPFCGSGTSLMACEDEDVSGLGMEISPSYVQIAIDRWNRTHPGQPAKRLDAAYLDAARKRLADEQARLGFEVTV